MNAGARSDAAPRANAAGATRVELARLVALADAAASVGREDDPLHALALEFFANNWRDAAEGLLARTAKVDVQPVGWPGPHAFAFRFDLPYKRANADGSVELVPGPITGTIRYRPDPFRAARGEATIAVFLDQRDLFNPNYSREYGVLCIGHVPAGPFPLAVLLEHLHALLSYQSTNVQDPADLEAARYFASEPDALRGLDHPSPLF